MSEIRNLKNNQAENRISNNNKQVSAESNKNEKNDAIEIAGKLETSSTKSQSISDLLNNSLFDTSEDKYTVNYGDFVIDFGDDDSTLYNESSPMSQFLDAQNQELLNNYPDILSEDGTINTDYLGQLITSQEIGQRELTSLILSGQINAQDIANLYNSGAVSMDNLGSMFENGVLSSSMIARIFGQAQSINHDETGTVQLDDGTNVSFSMILGTNRMQMVVRDSEGNYTEYRENHLKWRNNNIFEKITDDNQFEEQSDKIKLDIEKDKDI